MNHDTFLGPIIDKINKSYIEIIVNIEEIEKDKKKSKVF